MYDPPTNTRKTPVRVVEDEPGHGVSGLVYRLPVDSGLTSVELS